ncbi:PREDICTED: pyrimidodiazepine synthase-like [Nicrophorus vespilloides]|uniref:Pyrimidodiazepine synthase-like n=1 Tax=Nicrophorus vespilloides TaxID=110193 RepID=A0ABM1MAT0_NICVS|nr:PREDICTED: pyrimidodiazepine synthase-like [Nicrophorus vespilloides]
MSSLHLAAGSEQPAKVDGKLRLYSMEFCPYAHRSRLVLKAKNLPHDIVNVNLMNKPEWLFKIHPEGKVPTLDTGSEIIVESLDICNYLDDKYPEPPLYPSDEATKAKDKELIQKIGSLTAVFTKIIFMQEKKSPAEWLEELLPHLNVFEEELKKRGTVYFGGSNPGMVDYMLWPWGERAKTIGIILGEKLPILDGDLPCLRSWKKAIRNHPVPDSMYNGPEKFYKVVLFKTAGHKPEYDKI